MRQLAQTAVTTILCGLLLVCTGTSPGVNKSTVAAAIPNLLSDIPVASTTGLQTPSSARVSAEESAFLDQLAEDTWAYLGSDWATTNHLPWSWRSVTLSGGDYANPAEIGLYALSWLAAYDLQRSWSPSWTETEAEVSAILDQLRAWQTGSQSEQPNGPNAYQNSVFYRWYQISSTPPVVGANVEDHLVPSVDNAWLAASLITIREYAEASGHTALAQKADDILDDMDFTSWYHPDTHRFSWGDIEDPQGGAQADYYSNENRIINFVARALRQLSSSEYRSSLEALEQPPGTYAGITVEKVAWDGSYFTYAAPALFIREMGTPYGADTILPATQAQIAYAQYQNYDAWGLSDCYDVGEGGYVQQGAPPVAMPGSPETRPGLVTPHASTLALITTTLSSEIIANLQIISDTFDCAYDPVYGFRDSVMANPAAPDYGQCSDRFSALAQGCIFLTLVNHENGFIWDYFYRDAGVKAAHADLTGEYEVLLPIVLKPSIPPLIVADFNSCGPPNNLGGDMGAAYELPDRLTESYVQEPGRGCVVRLEYHITHWSAFWMKLQYADLSPYNILTFDIRADEPVPQEIKIELKRANLTEVEIIYVSGITADWQTMSVNLSDFVPTGYPEIAPLSSFTKMEELVFTFEASRSGAQGVVYLDNIVFRP